MPLIEIKHRWTGEILKSGEYADLKTALVAFVARGAYLQGADLQGADLQGADLQGAYLRGAYLRGAYLRGAYLRGAYLQGADLQGAYLQGAYLRGAYLRGAYLQGADLRGADLRGAHNAELASAMTVIVPEGDLRVWKQCQNKVLVHLLIPADAKRSNATGRKCRAQFADVLDVIGAEAGVSLHDGRTTYRKGERVTCDRWEEDRFIECGGGIHFYLTKEEAAAN